MKYNFDEVIDRKGTHAVKVERLPKGADKDSLALWVADMDFACAEPILKALHERIDRKIFGYTMYEADECMDAVTGWMKKRYGWEESRENLFFCPGVVAAYAALINLLTEPGDGIVLQRPIYYPFTNKANSNGRIPVDNALIYENGAYRIDFEDLDKKMADPANKVLVVCSPHNPTGRVWTEDELKKTVEIVVCTAPSKTFNLAGMKTSNIVIHNKELQKKWKDYVNGSLSMDGASALGMTAMIAAYTEGEEWLEQLKDYLDGNFAYIDEYLKKYLPKAHLVKAEGTYLAWIDLNGYVDRDEKKMEELMQKKAKVALDEGYIFGDEGRGFERINVASPRSVIEECMNRIRTAFEEEKLV